MAFRNREYRDDDRLFIATLLDAERGECMGGRCIRLSTSDPIFRTSSCAYMDVTAGWFAVWRDDG